MSVMFQNMLLPSFLPGWPLSKVAAIYNHQSHGLKFRSHRDKAVPAGH